MKKINVSVLSILSKLICLSHLSTRYCYLAFFLNFCCPLCVQIRGQLKSEVHGGDISPVNQLLLTLRFYATGSFQLVVGDTFGVHKSTVCRVVHRVTAAVAGLRPTYVRFPATEQERHSVMNGFYSVSGLPGVIGAIDCTHVPIQSPGGDEAEIYRNQKGYFSVNVQLICDQTAYVSDIVCRWPGSVHDSTIFDNSHLRVQLEGSAHDGYLIGDGGYPCRRYLLTPVVNPTTNAEKAYNAAHVSARNCIERTNGIIKRRFPALKYGLRVTVDHALAVIVAAVVMHNVAVMMGDDEPPEDELLSRYIQRIRYQGIQVDFDPVEVGPPDSAGHHGLSGMRQAVINSHFN